MEDKEDIKLNLSKACLGLCLATFRNWNQRHAVRVSLDLENHTIFNQSKTEFSVQLCFFFKETNMINSTKKCIA